MKEKGSEQSRKDSFSSKVWLNCGFLCCGLLWRPKITTWQSNWAT